MYLSRLILNPRSNKVRRELADVYQLHRTILRAFPERLPPNERVLFRVDVNRRTGVPTVLVQSQTAPNWSLFPHHPDYRDYLLQVPPPEQNPACKPYNPSISRGQILVFRLRANPTFRRDGKRRAWVREEDQRAWLDRQAEKGGFRLVQLTVIPEGMNQTRKQDGHQNYQIRHFAVLFQGLIQVTDPDKFHRTLATGVGPAKAFGCGLLSIAPAH
jgi:CRISPR system Cascade subunit CasE